MFNRDVINHRYEINLYDPEWNLVNKMLEKNISKNITQIPKPKNLGNMLKFCRDVCTDKEACNILGNLLSVK